MKTKKIYFLLFLLIFSLALYEPNCGNIFSPSESSSDDSDSGQQSSQAWVEVELSSGGVENFEYDYFHIGGHSTLYIKDFSCTSHTIKKSDWQRIIVYGETWSSCLKSNEFEMKVYHANTSLHGHDNINSYYASGNDLNDGHHKSVALKNVDEIIIHR